MIRAYPTYFKKCILNQIAEIRNIKEYDECYSRFSFNEQGDNIYNESHEERFEFDSSYKSEAPKVDEETANRLNELNSYVNEHGGTMFIAGYPIAVKEEDLTEQRADYGIFQKELEDLMDCEVISEYTDYFMDYDYFYNTNLHLTSRGARIRTEQLIKDLSCKLQ